MGNTQFFFFSLDWVDVFVFVFVFLVVVDKKGGKYTQIVLVGVFKKKLINKKIKKKKIIPNWPAQKFRNFTWGQHNSCFFFFFPFLFLGGLFKGSGPTKVNWDPPGSQESAFEKQVLHKLGFQYFWSSPTLIQKQKQNKTKKKPFLKKNYVNRKPHAIFTTHVNKPYTPNIYRYIKMGWILYNWKRTWLLIKYFLPYYSRNFAERFQDISSTHNSQHLLHFQSKNSNN